MALAPPGATTRRAAFTLLELLVVIALVAVLTGIVLGVGRRAVESGRVARAKAEIAALGAALETYQRTYGDYPRTDDAARLLQSLLGRKGPANVDIAGRSLIEVTRFTLAGSVDPFTNPAAVLVDPWGQAYRYAYKTAVPWSKSGYVLYSCGPDASDFSRLLAGGFPDTTQAANADNIHANP
jgi:general secretion pathway protein G